MSTVTSKTVWTITYFWTFIFFYLSRILFLQNPKKYSSYPGGDSMWWCLRNTPWFWNRDERFETIGSSGTMVNIFSQNWGLITPVTFPLKNMVPHFHKNIHKHWVYVRTQCQTFRTDISQTYVLILFCKPLNIIKLTNYYTWNDLNQFNKLY